MVQKTDSTNHHLKKNCLNGWDKYRTDAEKYPRLYDECGCCIDCMQLKGGHYCK